MRVISPSCMPQEDSNYECDLPARPPYPGATVVLVGRKGGGKTSFLNFLIGSSFLSEKREPGTPLHPSAIVRRCESGEERDLRPFVLDDEELEKRLVRRSHARQTYEVSGIVLEPELVLPWLPEDTRIVDLPGFDTLQDEDEARKSRDNKKNETNKSELIECYNLQLLPEKWIEEADLIVFVDTLDAYRNRGYGKLLKKVFGRSSFDADRTGMVLINQSDKAYDWDPDGDGRAESLRKEFFEHCNRLSLKIKEDQFFTFSSRLRLEMEGESLQWIREKGHLDEIRRACKSFFEHLKTLYLLHTNRRSRELFNDAKEWSDSSRKDGNEKEKLGKHMDVFEEFLTGQRQFQAIRQERDRLLDLDRGLAGLENSGSKWADRSRENLAEVDFEPLVPEEETMKFFLDLHEQTRKEVVRSILFWLLFWRRDQIFLKALEMKCRPTVKKVIKDLRNGLLSLFDRLVEAMESSLREFSQDLLPIHQDELEKIFEARRTELKYSFALSLSQLKNPDDLEFQKIQRSWYWLISEWNQRQVLALASRELGPYEGIMEKGREAISRFLEESLANLHELAKREASGVGHELRDLATQGRKEVKGKISEQERKLEPFESASDRLTRARGLLANGT